MYEQTIPTQSLTIFPLSKVLVLQSPRNHLLGHTWIRKKVTEVMKRRKIIDASCLTSQGEGFMPNQQNTGILNCKFGSEIGNAVYLWVLNVQFFLNTYRIIDHLFRFNLTC